MGNLICIGILSGHNLNLVCLTCIALDKAQPVAVDKLLRQEVQCDFTFIQHALDSLQIAA